MSRYIKILILCFPLIINAQTDTINNEDGYVTPVFERGCSSCYDPIHLQNYCHQVIKSSLKFYDLRGREFSQYNRIPIGTIYIKTGIMMDLNRKKYPFIIKEIRINE
jgi:hypothetical protein